MSEFRDYNSIDKKGKPTKLTIASGPVIIEDNKVLLDKHGEDPFWKFPGGALDENRAPKENAIFEAKSELGIDIKILSKPFVLVLEREKKGVSEYVILIHYLAKRLSKEIKPGKYVREHAWHSINRLPADCAPNIELAVNHFSKNK